ncbi:hypothetical protein GBA63_01110 [Rubrobacter tropicus]|uniref:Uncharacterized protein n=1 Tax=Rubrobacter tropicus TaxID=2653851 RepID=A0A6G8Q4X4_9ACTN|nr:chitobiase/beta-hexosaminidase C-terminal domain-containing protein [Rubrobacter tropicus]QIN81377.1 hypothetical protein GBA63_01110 [Rubrobacter tropicus]
MIGNYKQALVGGKENGRGTAVRITLAAVAALLLLSAVLGGLASPVRAQEQSRQGLAESGPINPDSGFPFWYKDHSGAKLELCLNPKPATVPDGAPNAGAPNPGGGRCLTPFEMPDENAPMVFPDNFPGEAFWWTGEAHIEDPNDPNATNALLVMAAESAFANENPKEGDQMSFGRVRVRIDNGVPGATYRVTHPYGIDTVVAEDKDGDPATANDGRVFVTEDIGCFPTAITTCNFDKMLNGRVGPFLKWDTFGNGTDGDEATPADENLMALDADGNPDPNRPDAYFGDPDTPHKVVGSPKGTNYFKIEQIKDGAGRPLAEPALVGETDLFAVTGKVAELRLAAEAVGAEGRADTVFNDKDQKIKLVPSEPGSEVYYTTDGSDPADGANPNRKIYDPNGAGVALESDPTAAAGVDTRVRAIAVKDGKTSAELDRTYTVDLVAPNVVFSGLAAGKHEEPGDLTIAATQKARVYYTTDGSDPTDEANPNRRSFVYDPAPGAQNEGNVLNIARTQTVKAAALDLNHNEATGQDEEGAWSRIKSRKFVVANLKVGPVNPHTGFPFWYEDRNGVRLDQCLNPVAAPEAGGGYCATPMEMPADWQPGDGVRFPDRFPGEAFWWTGESSMDTSERGSADLIMALEAAFLNEEPNPNDRMVFGRIRIRVDDLIIGETYKVTHPYGVDTYVAEDNGKGSGEINVTEDIGCMLPSEAEPCDFNEARFSRVGPFLTLADKTKEPTDAPDGGRYLADPVTDQDVVQGSPIMAHADPNDPDSPMVPANFFRVEGPGIRAVQDEESAVDFNRGTAEKPYIQSDFFSVTGRYSEFQAAASAVGGFYNRPLDVTLGASEFDARIFYTLDGSEPVGADGQPTENAREFVAGAPIQIPANGETTLKYAATSATHPRPTKVYTEVYKMDTEAPVVVAEDTPEAGSVVEGARVFENVNPAVRLSVANEPGKVKIFYTTNGTDPSDPTNVDRALYDAATPVVIRKDTTLKFWAVDEAGNSSEVGAQAYDIVDNQAPNVPSVDLAAESDTGKSNEDNVTNAASLTFTGDAEAGSAVKILVNGTERGSAVAGEDNRYSVTIAGLAPGADLPVTATATDQSGNTSAATDPALSLTIDRTAPRVTAQAAAGTYPRAHTVTLTPNEAASVHYTLNGAVDPAPGAAGTTEGNSVRIANARDTLRFLGVDTAGNVSQTFVAEYRIRNFLPTISNMSPTTAIRDATPRVAATVNDSDSDLTEADVTLSINGRAIPRSAFVYNADTNRLTYQVPAGQPLDPGRYNVRVTATDVDGGSAARSWSFTIRNR